ncbi:hypothetical protein AC482_06255 [miscellaneous Crenarchaeota group-15 archaeon DG-45]|uniref:Radical SAM core domain-containing protein n=1 Tax=miscellaneous Crenarchaeota group-15 archaeon DG-45 TaxID=1685127 RepID=A0A0M0BLW9_9ARCH|nr:MAG: hypothetical protein AC482_06255 [miscellaneous Crenarchaeota group-15 archaeon DG-45]
MEAAGTARDRHLGRELRFYYPLPRFPNASVTGSRCALRCRHCGGRYLEGMTSVETPSKLRRFCADLEARGAIGLLVSGGSDARGRVPLGPFLDALRWAKENTGLIVNVHTGLLDAAEAEEIASAGVDIASVDVVGSDETIRRVYGLDATAGDYRETLEALRGAGVPSVVPHICVGLDHGEIRGEAAALGMVQGFDPDLVVILGLIPTPGTPMEAVDPPSAEDMARAVAAARLMCPRAGVALGCMRARNDKARTEELVIAAGADRIVLPARATIEKAAKQGFDVKHLDGCCSIPRSLEHRSLRR